MEKKQFEQIKNARIFNNIELEKIEELLEKIKYKIIDFHEDESIVFRGEEVKGLYIVLEGDLFCEMSGDRGDVKKIEDMPAGSILASAFIFGKNNVFPVDVLARNEGRIFFVEKQEFLKLLQMDIRIMENILNLISQKAQFLSSKIWQGVNNKTIKQKLSDYILNNLEGNEVKFKPSLSEVANLFNIARPSLSRVIVSFVDEGILERKGRKYFVKDMERLKEI